MCRHVQTFVALPLSIFHAFAELDGVARSFLGEMFNDVAMLAHVLMGPVTSRHPPPQANGPAARIEHRLNLG